MEVLKQSPEKIILRGEISHSLSNAIRRSVEEIPTLAVDEVEFFKNDSALYDEVIAHRIGLIPFKTEKKISKKTKMDVKLNKKGPCVVYSGDLQGGAKVVHNNIPITLLEKDQELQLVATLRLGKGTEHAKFVPGLCYYRNLAKIKSKNPKVEGVVNSSKSFVKDKKTGEWICDLSDAELYKIEEIDNKSVNYLEGDVIFVVESFGHMDSKDILVSSINTLSDNLQKFEKGIK